MSLNSPDLKIPEKFHNSLSENPFEHCKMCERELLESNSDYVIEKAYRRFKDEKAEELLFEVAICMKCANSMRTKLSKESLSSIQNFFFQKSMERRQAMDEMEELLQDPLSQCLLNGKALEEMDEYQIYAHCSGYNISTGGGYYMLSDTMIEEIQSLLSKETRDELERFTDENLGLPPELKELFSRGDLISI